MRADPEDVLELYISEDGRYEGANDAALATFGYTVEELRELRVGALSNTPPEAAAEAWRQFVESGTPVVPGGLTAMVTKDGRRLTMAFLGTERGGPYGGFVSRSKPSEAEGARLAGPWRRRALLAEWRLAERELSKMALDDPPRPAAEATVDDLRRRYQDDSWRE